VEKALRAMPGMHSANVNFANQSALITYEPNALRLSDAQQAVRNAGYDLLIESKPDSQEADQSQEKAYQALKRNTLTAFLLSVPLVVLAMFFYQWPLARWVELVLAAPVVFWFGRQFFVNAYKQALHLNANMDTLVALSTGIAYVFSLINTVLPSLFSNGMSAMGPPVYFESAAVVISFILLGKLLEHRAKDRTSGALKKLMSLQPTTVRLIRNGVEADFPIASVLLGDSVIIRPGERIPVDGVVLKGESYIDESMLTGEPIANEKQTGSKVFAGTINQRGSLTIVASAVGSTTLLAQIIKRVQQAQGSKAPIEKLVDKVAGIFVPVVIGAAVLTFVAWMIFGGAAFIPQALLASVTVLIIACPCALGLATPTALIVSMGKAADNGILIRDAQSLEIAHRIDTIVLDKTGTITEGAPKVTSLIWNVDAKEIEHYSGILYALERASEHPLAEAVTQHLALTGNASSPLISKFESLTGKGVKAESGDRTFFVGSARLLAEHELSIPTTIREPIEESESSGSTIVYFFTSQQLLAAISIGDPIKVGSADAIESLRKLGISTVMLTGDSKSAATAVARLSSVDSFEAELLPQDKGSYIHKLQAKGHIVGMIGDGINDSEALAQADVGIAMGKGTDIAMEVAHMTIISSDLRQVSKAIKLSRATVRTIKQNLFWAFIYNLIGIPLAAGVLYPSTGFMLSPMIAGAAMALSSVSVVTNSLRLKRLVL
jgi:Cu2+-exporting ATPase